MEGEASEVAFFRFGLGEESIVHVRPSCGRRDSARVDGQTVKWEVQDRLFCEKPRLYFKLVVRITTLSGSPVLTLSTSEGVRSQILCQRPYLVVQYEFSNYQCGFVDNPDDEGEVQARNFYHQAYLSFDSFVRLIIFVSRNSASPSLSAARKAHSRAKIVVGSPMPPPTTVSM